MRPELTNQEFMKLKSMFSDYRTYRRGLSRFLLIGLYVTLAGIGIVALTMIAVVGEFRLDVFLIMTIGIFLLYLLFAFFIWGLVISRNASKLEERLYELKMTEEELENMIKADIANKLGL